MSTFHRDEPLTRQSFRADVGDGLRTLRIAPWGKVESKSGAFVVDDASASAVVAAFERHGAALSIDIEHASLSESVRPADRGAVGWIEKLWAEPDRGLFALVRWTPRGRELIQADAFRYFSPTFLVRKDDGRVVELLNGAITTAPAIPASERIAASRSQGRESMMENMKKLHEALRKNGAALAEGADETAIVACAIQRLSEAAPPSGDREVASAVRSHFGLKPDAGVDAVVLALSVSAHGTAAGAELAKMQDAERERMATEMVAEAVRVNKINRNHKEGYAAALSLARRDPDQFRAIIAGVTTMFTPGRTVGPPAPRGDGNRTAIIASARKSYRENETTRKLTSLKAWTNDALREAGLAILSAEEEKAVG